MTRDRKTLLLQRIIAIGVPRDLQPAEVAELKNIVTEATAVLLEANEFEDMLHHVPIAAGYTGYWEMKPRDLAEGIFEATRANAAREYASIIATAARSVASTDCEGECTSDSCPHRELRELLETRGVKIPEAGSGE